tara:strand:+ start:37543 stop:38478 length:936 start_codon:yes stop_codon:yes gene_type:complete
MLDSYLIFIISLIALIYGSNLVIDQGKLIALKFKISNLIIGVTVIAFGTSFPELIVGVLSAIKNEGDIAISNVIGSNIANIGLVLGTVAIIKPINIISNSKLLYNLFYLFFSSFLFICICFFNQFSRPSGVFLLVVFLFYMYILLKRFTRDNSFLNDSDDIKLHLSHIFKLILGFLFLAIGSEYLIGSVIDISNKLNFKNNIAVSMSLVAFGTSVPELMTSLIALIKKEEGLAIGNILGSNIINVLLIISLSSIASPISLNFDLIRNHILILIILTASLIVFMLFMRRINRISGYFFISVYFIFIYVNFLM